MRLFDMVMFLALIGGLSGAFQYVQDDLSTSGDGVNWWSGYSVEEMDTIVVDSSDVDAMNTESTIVSSVEDFYNAVYFAVGLLWNVIKGIFWVKGSILDVVLVYSDDNGNNILEPINYMIQAAIYLVALFGWYQIKAKQPMGSGY